MHKIFHPSPNFDDRHHTDEISVLVMHYTGMTSMQAALDRLCDPQAKVSAHYLVDEDGAIYQLVEDEKRAWHAGISCWHGRAQLNDVSIGIEIVNPGHEFGYRPFPEAQMEAVAELSLPLLEKYHIPPRNVVGHSDISPRRKEDPGEYFNWKWLAEKGVGVWPEVPMPRRPHEEILFYDQEGEDVAKMQKDLRDYGYHLLVDGYFGPKTKAVVIAFKRHFIQDQVDHHWDRRSAATLEVLLDMVTRDQTHLRNMHR